MHLENVEVSKISITDNIRDENWEKDISELVESIKTVGLLQPPTVIRKKDGSFSVVYGARRVAACKQLKMKTIPAFVIENRAAKEIWPQRLAENISRKNLQPLEEARIFKYLKEELQLTAKEIAKAIGVTESYISQRLQLLSLPEEVQEALKKSQIDFTQARSLARIANPKEQSRLLKIAKKCSPEYFREKLEEAPKKETNRGRPKKEKNKVKTITEIKKAAVEIDKARMAAIEAGNRLQEEFLKGMLRGLGWAGGMVDTLL